MRLYAGRACLRTLTPLRNMNHPHENIHKTMLDLLLSYNEASIQLATLQAEVLTALKTAEREQKRRETLASLGFSSAQFAIVQGFEGFEIGLLPQTRLEDVGSPYRLSEPNSAPAWGAAPLKCVIVQSRDSTSEPNSAPAWARLR